MQMQHSLASNGASEADVNATHVGCEFRQSHLRCDMDSRKRKGMGTLGFFPVLHVEECTCERGLTNQPHLTFAHGGRIAEGVSERPDRASQNLFQGCLAFLNFAARFFVAA